MTMPAAELRRAVIELLITHAHTKTAGELRESKHYTKGELAAIQAAEGQTAPGSAPTAKPPAPNVPSVPRAGEVGHGVRARRHVPSGRRARARWRPDRPRGPRDARSLRVTHTTTERKVAEFGSREDALAFAMDLNRAESVHCSRSTRLGMTAWRWRSERPCERLAPSRLERWRIADEARQIDAATRRQAPVTLGTSLRERIVNAVRVHSRSAEVLAGLLGADPADIREQLALLLASGGIVRTDVPHEGPPEYIAMQAPARVAGGDTPPAVPSVVGELEAARLALPALPSAAHELRWRVLNVILMSGRTAAEDRGGAQCRPGPRS